MAKRATCIYSGIEEHGSHLLLPSYLAWQNWITRKSLPILIHPPKHLSDRSPVLGHRYLEMGQA